MEVYCPGFFLTSAVVDGLTVGASTSSADRHRYHLDRFQTSKRGTIQLGIFNISEGAAHAMSLRFKARPSQKARCNGWEPVEVVHFGMVKDRQPGKFRAFRLIVSQSRPNAQSSFCREHTS